MTDNVAKVWAYLINDRGERLDMSGWLDDEQLQTVHEIMQCRKWRVEKVEIEQLGQRGEQVWPRVNKVKPKEVKDG